jgi:signal transduction histidine kinase
VTTQQDDLVAQLMAHRTLGAAPVAELEWLARHGRVKTLDRGMVLTSRTGPVAGMYVILSGHLTIHVNRGAGPRKVMEWRAGDVTGMLPYSRLQAPPADVVAQEPTEILALDRDRLRDLIQSCHEVTTILVHVMLDRVRQFKSSEVQDEKMVSLGKLAAGLAHELNNPASAVARNARELHAAVSDLESAARELGASGIGHAQIAALDALRDGCLTASAGATRSAIERSDHEEALDLWLDAHGIDTGLAGSLADAGIGPDHLDRLRSTFADDQLPTVVRWMAARCRMYLLASETEAAASRVHTLVAAVKGFTYMDQAAAPTPVDIARGLADTTAILASKARARSANFKLDVEPDLPRVYAIGGELNQVWANLIENALDAIPSSGDVTVSARREGSDVVVRVVDNGPGIPPEIQMRIFDPFFTTKPVGSGTGLGLDIVQRVVRRAQGNIDFSTQPGRTEFRVNLPISPHDAG